MESPINSATRPLPTQLVLLFILSLFCTQGAPTTNVPLELQVGFKATPSTSTFQPILNDPSGNFSLGFLRVSKDQLTLAVTHLPSLQPLWQPQPRPRWSSTAEMLFNGSIVISDPETGSFWSTGTRGDKVVLLNTSNLVVQNHGAAIWESFEFPLNTLVESQNFSSDMTLVSSNGLYSMSLGEDYMALFARFNPGRKEQMYWKHKALEAKADVVPGNGPIYARVQPDGFFGMYQTGTGPPVDVQAFNSFNRPVYGFLIVRLEPDGNLKGYSWDGVQWLPEYQAISSTCELPSPCGPYGLCRAGSGSDPCSCLDNRTVSGSGQCADGAMTTGDFCNATEFGVLRRKGLELPFKELMGYETVSSVEECEGICERNCTCWGAVYNNASGLCYLVDYPIQTMLGVGDQSKVGYFKMRTENDNASRKRRGVGLGVGLGVLGGAVLALVGAVWFVGYRRRGVRRILEEEGGVSPGPYKDLGSASFRSIEMCSSSERK